MNRAAHFASDAGVPTPVLIVPGRGNSGPGHWQSHLEAACAGSRRVDQSDWENPKLDAWSRAIDRAVRACQRAPLIVAHSFGCLAAAHAQMEFGTPVGATLFVAPADPQRFALSRSDFARALDRPALMLVSRNDPWLAHGDALALAEDWGIDALDLGAAGHVNIDSGYGRWPFGEAIVALMRERLDAGPLAASSDATAQLRQKAA